MQRPFLFSKEQNSQPEILFQQCPVKGQRFVAAHVRQGLISDEAIHRDFRKPRFEHCFRTDQLALLFLTS